METAAQYSAMMLYCLMKNEGENSSAGRSIADAVVSEDGSSIIVTLQNSAVRSDAITLDYKGGDLTSDADPVASFENFPVVNNTFGVTVKPTVNKATIDGNTILMRFTIPLYGVSTPKPDAFAATGVSAGNAITDGRTPVPPFSNFPVVNNTR